MCFEHPISNQIFKFVIPSDLKFGLKTLEYSYNLNYDKYAQLAWGPKLVLRIKNPCSKSERGEEGFTRIIYFDQVFGPVILSPGSIC
jgi:hypothetical protein